MSNTLCLIIEKNKKFNQYFIKATNEAENDQLKVLLQKKILNILVFDIVIKFINSPFRNESIIRFFFIFNIWHSIFI